MDKKEVQDNLFPDGKPEPEEFIKTLAELAKAILESQNQEEK